MISRRVFAHLRCSRLVSRLVDVHCDILFSPTLGPPDHANFLSVPVSRRTHPSWPTGTWLPTSSSHSFRSAATDHAANPPPSVLSTAFENRTGHCGHVPDQSRAPAPRGIPGLDGIPSHFASGSPRTGWLPHSLCASSSADCPTSLGATVRVATCRPLNRLLTLSACIQQEHSLPEQETVLSREDTEQSVVDLIVTGVKSIDLQSCVAPDGTALLDRLEAAIEEKLAIGVEFKKGPEAASSSRRTNDIVEGSFTAAIKGYHVTYALKKLSNGVMVQGLLHWAVKTRKLILRPQLVTFYIEALGQTGDLRSLGLLEHSVRQLGLTLDDVHYSCLMKVYCTLRRPDLALEVPKRMKARSVPLAAGSYSALMAVYKRQGRYNKVLEVLREMQESGAEVTLYMHGIIIDACRQVRDIDSAERQWNRMIAQGIRPSCAIVSSMLTMYKSVGDVGKATAVFLSSSELQVPLNNHILNAFMDILCKQGLASQAESLLQRALQEGLADLATWGSLIHMFGTRHGALHGLKCFLQSVEAGTMPGEQMFAILIHVLLQHSSYAEAEHLLTHLIAHGPRPGLAVVSPLLMACTEADEEKLPAMVHLLKASGHEVVKLLQVLAQAYKGRELTTARAHSMKVPGNWMPHTLQSAASIADKILAQESATGSKGANLKRQFSNALLGLLQTLGLEEAATALLPVFFSHHVYDANVLLDPKQWKDGVCTVDLHGVGPQASVALLIFVLEKLKHLKRDGGIVPMQLTMITRRGRASLSNNVQSSGSTMGAVWKVLRARSLHFRVVNQGCLAVSEVDLHEWLSKAPHKPHSTLTPQEQGQRFLDLIHDDAHRFHFKENHAQRKILQQALERLL